MQTLRFGVALVATVGLLGAGCAPSQSSEPPAPSTGATVPTVAPSTSGDTSTTMPLTMPPLPTGEPVGISLPPRFAAAGVDIPVTVSVDAESVGVDVVDSSGVVLTTLSPVSSQFWMGAIPGSAVTGQDLVVTPVAHGADGAFTEGPPITIVVIPENGPTLERHEVDAEVSVIYDRPWSSEPGELSQTQPQGEGENTDPAGLARIDHDEVAVLDTAAERVVCFDLTGASTCTINLPIPASGDIFPLGDGTLAVIDLSNHDGEQGLDVLRVDPRTGLTEVIYHEWPLVVSGYPGVATNTTMTWDPPARTAWVGLPEPDWPPVSDEPDPSRFLSTDALHLDPDGVERGPTVQRTTLRPDQAMSQPGSYRWLDGNSWVTFYDTPAPYYSTLGMEVTASGAIWMLTATGHSDGLPTYELIRWRPGDSYFEAVPIDVREGGNSTRTITVLDDDTVAVLDINIIVGGGRLRAFTFPPFATG